MSFDINKCDIPTIWCGDKSIPKKKKGSGSVYTRKGTRVECMRKGFGAGMYKEINKGLSKNSLRQIKYVGEKHESLFVKHKINNIKDLIKISKTLSSSAFEKLLKKVLTRKDDKLDKRAYNSVLRYLYLKGITKLPECKKIKK